MSASCETGLAVKVCADGDRLAVAPRGEIDVETAPLLMSVMRGFVDSGHPSVVLDLGDVSFMGAAGIGVIAQVATWLTPANGTLTVRSASPLVVRMLHATGVGDLVELEPARSAAAHLSGGKPAADLTVVIGQESVEDVSNLVTVGSMIAATALVDRALHLVTVLAQAAIDGADGVSVSLERHERISTVAWSNDTVLQMDLHQYQTGEGPCLDAAKSGQSFHTDPLAREERWPAFVPRALEQGIASIWSTPLTTPDRPVGALNIYSNTEGALGATQVMLAGLFAEQASGIVTASLTDDDAAPRLARALVHREVIAQAQGVLMERDGGSARDAAAHLFAAARDAELTLSEHAATVIASTRREQRHG